MEQDGFDRLQAAAERVAGRAQYEQGNRRGLLWTHALMGMIGGLQMLAYGGPGTIENIVGTAARTFLGMAAILGGVLLATGLSTHPRNIRLETIGLCVMGLWDFAMTAGLLYGRLEQHDFHFIPLGEPMPAGYVVAYPVTIYGGLFALICIHLYTLRKITKAGLRL